jgi:HAD superfamily hydrolase (TIGR01549 family)
MIKSKSNIKGVFFDLFGTLLIYDDLELAWSAWFEEFYSKISKLNKRLKKEEFSKLCEGFFTGPEPEGDNETYTKYEWRIKEFCDANRLYYKETTIREMADESVNAWHKYVSRDPLVGELLAKIRKTKTTALISNFDHPRHIHKKIKEYGWKDLFDMVVISAEAGIKKPDKRIFQPVLDKFNLLPGEVVFIGDSKEDMEGAINAGIRPLLISRNGSSNKMQYDYNTLSGTENLHEIEQVTVISSLDEVLNFI